MTTAPPGMAALAIAITFFLVLAIAGAVWRTTGDLAAPARRRARVLAFLWLWAAVLISGFMASQGLLRDFASQPPPLMRLILALSIATVALAFSSAGTAVVRRVPLWGLIAFQSFRVLVELLLWGLHREGRLPVQMTFEGRNFDVLTGLSAIAMAWGVRRGWVAARGVLVWNVLGLALLLNIVAIAVLSMPSPMRVFLQEPANRIVAELPFVWIPCVMVQAALLAHVLIFRALKRPPPLAQGLT